MQEIRAAGIDEPAARATGSGWAAGRALSARAGYFADFVAVRRQRVQTSAFTDEPLRVIV